MQDTVPLTLAIMLFLFLFGIWIGILINAAQYIDDKYGFKGLMAALAICLLILLFPFVV